MGVDAVSGDRFEIVQRLKVAQERSREAYEQTFKGHDLHPGTDIAGAWPFITAAYSGIEQTFKFQIAEAVGKTVEELVATRGPKGSKGEGRTPYRHHNLGSLFRSLDDPAQEALAEEYRRFRTLHGYIEPATVVEFLDVVSAEDGRGYERWRYSLTAPEEKIPTNSADALLSIWDAAVQLCEKDRGGWQLRGVYEQLTDGFAWSLQETMRKLNSERMERADRAEAYHDFWGEARNWMRARGGLLNGHAELVDRAHRGWPPTSDVDGVSAAVRGVSEAVVGGRRSRRCEGAVGRTRVRQPGGGIPRPWSGCALEPGNGGIRGCAVGAPRSGC